MSVEHERLTIPMDLELKWAKEKLLERDKHILKLAEENSKLREELREDIGEGITLRDHFAGLAIQGFISLNKFNTDMIVKLSYDMADAMLAEREKNDK
jgi:hypothetical protein